MIKKTRAIFSVASLLGLAILPAVALAQTTNTNPADFCGGIAGKMCPTGYVCKYYNTDPDSTGKCVKNGTKLEDIKKEVANKLEELRQVREVKREEVKNKLEEFKQARDAKIKEVKTKIETEREAMKAKVAKIKDEKKKAALEKAIAGLNKINSNRTEHFTNVINQIEKVLEKIKDRIAKAETKGRDVSTAKAAITTADTAILAARSAITTQIEKTYSVVITTEDKLREKANEAKELLRKDLSKVQDIVTAARQSVHRAATTLAKVPRVDDDSDDDNSNTTATSTAPALPPTANTTGTTTNNQ